ncbi:MAG: S8 family serine peptidase [Planctomycetes bacterium]|nr:S8 family serine peptidase [Planctomycetota bacterium]
MRTRGGKIQRGKATAGGLRMAPAICAVLLCLRVAPETRGAEPLVGAGELTARAAELLPSRIVVRLTPRAIGRSAKSSLAQPQSAKLLSSHKHRREVCWGDHHDKSRARSRVHHGVTMPIGVTEEFATVCDGWGIAGVKPLYAHRFMNPEVAARVGLDRTFVVDVPPGADAAAMAADFAKLTNDVETVSVDSIAVAAQFIPDDALFDRQYGMNNMGQSVSGCPSGAVPDADIDAPEAWDIHTGDLGTVTIAIVDSGVTPHAEFAGRMVAGMNMINNDPLLTDDDCPHGTLVAGVAAAEGGNGIGVAGVTWGANIMPVKVLQGFGFDCIGSRTNVARGIVWAVDHGADICNVSIEILEGAEDLELAVIYAVESGVLVVSAVGNNPSAGDHVVRFPAAYSGSMAISATDNRDQLAWFSRYGNEVDVAAPGGCIWSTSNDGGYTQLSGTSFSAPHVSGLAALLKSLDPTLTNIELRNLITSTADDLGAAGWDSQFGFGRINAYSAVLQAGDPRILTSDPPDGAIDARQPVQPDGSPNELGFNVWQWIDLTFPASTTSLAAGDFSITEDPDTGVELRISTVFSKPNFFRVLFNRQLSVGSWTTITHLDSGTSVRLGLLPGDVDGDGIVSIPDLTAAVRALDGQIGPLPLWSTDLNRSGATTAQDLLREVDLLSGVVGVYDAFLGASLPP